MVHHMFRKCVCLIVLSAFGSCNWPAHEENPEFWNDSAEQTLRSKYAQMKPQAKPARNVILFIGDGMGLSTITAGRILKGQLNGRAGEETITALDKFTETGLSKVYCVDKQSPDSGSTATAILSGVKTKFGVLGLDGRTVFKKCSSAAGNEVESILLKSANLGKSTGIVTTTEVQHATPAAAYAHSASRGWYADSSMNSTTKSEGCKDISLQLLEMGRKINVILGGGRSYMRPKGVYDEEYYSRHPGVRGDGRDLIREWRNLQPSNRARYVWNRPGFKSVNAQTTDYLMGLFQPRDLRFDYDRRRDVGGEPSLEEMTEKAIQILQKNPMGYFLLVEGGKIDHAHHQNKANIALREFVAFEKAVQKAMDMTSTDETLIVVTADHGHVFTLGGYANRGNPIHGFARDHSDPEKAVDKLHYTSIAYANGPGYSLDSTTGKRTELTGETTRAMGYRFQTAIPLKGESHSSEDTIVFARGPMSQLFSGVYEQNYIAHAMMFASCVGRNKTLCEQPIANDTDQTTTSNVLETLQTTASTTVHITPAMTSVPKTTAETTSFIPTSESIGINDLIPNLMLYLKVKLLDTIRIHSMNNSITYLEANLIVKYNGTRAIDYDITVQPYMNVTSTLSPHTMQNEETTKNDEVNKTVTYQNWESKTTPRLSTRLFTDEISTSSSSAASTKSHLTTTTSNAVGVSESTAKGVLESISAKENLDSRTMVQQDSTVTFYDTVSPSTNGVTSITEPQTSSYRYITESETYYTPTPVGDIQNNSAGIFTSTTMVPNVTDIKITTTLVKKSKISPRNRTIINRIVVAAQEIDRCLEVIRNSNFKAKVERQLKAEKTGPAENTDQEGLIIALGTLAATFAASTALLLAFLLKRRNRIDTEDANGSVGTSALQLSGSEGALSNVS